MRGDSGVAGEGRVVIYIILYIYLYYAGPFKLHLGV